MRAREMMNAYGAKLELYRQLKGINLLTKESKGGAVFYIQ
jgi:hypothetical protein